MARNDATKGSGNVYEDMGYPDADGVLAKALMVSQIEKLMKRRKLTDYDVAYMLGAEPTRIRKMLKGQFGAYPIDCIARFWAKLERSMNPDVMREKEPAR